MSHNCRTKRGLAVFPGIVLLTGLVPRPALVPVVTRAIIRFGQPCDGHRFGSAGRIGAKPRIRNTRTQARG